MILSCKHQGKIVEQVRPTIDLLTNMDELHPQILLQHNIQPADYKNSLVFRSAIESIRGTFIASSTTGREGLVRNVLENLRQQHNILNYEQSSSRRRYDFTVQLETDYFVALEVKGGEGNSINISERPMWAKEFHVWSHLDGAIVNQPAHGAHSIINRLTNELVRRQKLVDALFFKDIICGTRTRPCPKYPGQEDTIGLRTAPDVFLFPQRVPSIEDPEPPVHTLDTLNLPRLILNLFGEGKENVHKHVWQVHVKIIPYTKGRLRRSIQIRYQGNVIDESISRPWQP